MKTGFKDRTEVKEGKKIKDPFNYEMPPYDERSSCYIKIGTNYGVGHRQPIGTEKHTNFDGVPKGRVNTLKTDYIHHGHVKDIELDEEE